MPTECTYIRVCNCSVRFDWFDCLSLCVVSLCCDRVCVCVCVCVFFLRDFGFQFVLVLCCADVNIHSNKLCAHTHMC